MQQGAQILSAWMPTKERGDRIELPAWWLLRVQEIFSARKENQTAVGKQLAAAVGRARAWDHGAVSRFLDGKVTTREMADAFALIYGLPPPYFTPRSIEEALDFQGVAMRHGSPANDEKQQRTVNDRVRTVREMLKATEESVEDHTRSLESTDAVEGRHRSGRARRAPRGRASSS